MIIGESESSLYYSCNFSVRWTFFQIKSLREHTPEKRIRSGSVLKTLQSAAPSWRRSLRTGHTANGS